MKEFFKGAMHMTIEEMKEKKREHGYTYNMMSQMSGVPLGTVQKIFTGETKSPRYDTLEALARIFENGDRDYLYADMVEDSGTAYAAKVQGQYTLDDYYALPLFCEPEFCCMSDSVNNALFSASGSYVDFSSIKKEDN